MSKTGTGKYSLKAVAARLAGAATVFYTLPVLMALLVCGTIAQRYIGLYEAQRMFFSSFILWLGPLPLPGGYLVSGVIALSLAIKFLFFSDWSWRKAGIHITHLGILVLLLGGLVTALQAHEGFMTIYEGETSASVSDYHQREIVISKDGAIIQTIPSNAIAAGRPLAQGLPFQTVVRFACQSCKIIKREEAQEEYGEPFMGMGLFMALTDGVPEKESEANLFGATISLSGTDDADGTYVLFDMMPKPVQITADGATYDIIYQKQQRPLPFSIRLADFEKGVYPGTSMARAYHSDIIVDDHGASWPVRIEMNKPLRYKGYTFFQSSFLETPQGTATVLSVVKNKGWMFPYIGTLIVALGLILHTFIMARHRRDA